jgi:hypothetical protein
MTIIGGGQTGTVVNKTLFTSHWKYGLDMGGSIDFNAFSDHRADSTDMSTSLALLLNARLKYEREKVEWESWLKVDESVDVSYSFTLNQFMHLRSASDDIRLQSLYTWHILPWFGPYGRMEMETELLPKYERGDQDSIHYFGITDNDSNLIKIDSIHDAILLQPAFSPFSVEAGVGTNINLIRNRLIEGRLLAGFGFKQTWQWNQAESLDSLPGLEDTTALTDIEKQYRDIPSDKTTVRELPNTVTDPEYGPEASLYGLLRLGRYATAESELKFFSPVKRITETRKFSPDLRWRATMSWRLLKAVTVDYQYEFELRQPLNEPTLHKKTSRHRVLLRFSITSR